MDVLDTGRIRISPHEGKYLLFTLYAEGEVTSGDMDKIREYLGRFDGKAPLLVVRECYYSFSSEAMMIMMKEAGDLISAVAYVDRSSQDTLLSEYAKMTYLRDLPVQSFMTREEAEAWIEEFSPLPAFASA
ncbi:MAG: hypothetical protein ABW120_01110 [Sedimenticola sp.]